MTTTPSTPQEPPATVTLGERDLASSFRDALPGAGADEASGAPTAADALLHDAVEVRATDIHVDPLGVAARIRFRIDGVMHDVAVLDADETSRVVNQLKARAGIDPVRTFAPEEARFTASIDGRDLNFRLALAPCLDGQKVNVRVLEPRRVEQQSLDGLGLDASGVELARGWLAGRSGLLVVSGPTGSGKTTTLYALLHELELADRSVVTIEDPSEYRIDNINQIQVDRERGLDYAAAIRVTLRLDPDDLMVGEMRDAPSASAALDAALGGRAVLTTLHSRDAASSVTALRHLGLADYEIASTLSVVISQRLVRTLCPHCRVSREPAPPQARWLRSAGLEVPESVWHPEGCDACHGVGYAGRTGVFELWRLDEDAYDLLLEHADERTLRREIALRRSRSLLEDALAKVERGVTSIEEMQGLGFASDPALAELE